MLYLRQTRKMIFILGSTKKLSSDERKLCAKPKLQSTKTIFLNVVGCGWMWLDVVGCGWMWLNVVECG